MKFLKMAVKLYEELNQNAYLQQKDLPEILYWKKLLDASTNPIKCGRKFTKDCLELVMTEQMSL